MTTKCTQTDEAFAWKPTWTYTAGEADQKATLTFSPTCTTAASLAPHLRMQEWNYSRAAIWKMLPSTAAPPLPSSCFAHSQCPLAAEASAEKSISTFLDKSCFCISLSTSKRQRPRPVLWWLRASLVGCHNHCCGKLQGCQKRNFCWRRRRDVIN